VDHYSVSHDITELILIKIAFADFRYCISHLSACSDSFFFSERLNIGYSRMLRRTLFSAPFLIIYVAHNHSCVNVYLFTPNYICKNIVSVFCVLRRYTSELFIVRNRNVGMYSSDIFSAPTASYRKSLCISCSNSFVCLPVFNCTLLCHRGVTYIVHRAGDNTSIMQLNNEEYSKPRQSK